MPAPAFTARAALLHRDLAHALASNPLPVAVLPLLAVMARNAVGPRTRSLAPLLQLLAEPRVWLWLLLGHTGLRNKLPWYPLTPLAPG